MSKQNQRISKQLAKCPFCNEELERHCTSRYYMHKLNGCILQHFCFEADDELSIDLWNTRKPMERIVERLEERQEEQFKLYALAFKPEDRGGYDAYSDAIEIVREEGGMNE